jgi:hypothetical protein
MEHDRTITAKVCSLFRVACKQRSSDIYPVRTRIDSSKQSFADKKNR